MEFEIKLQANLMTLRESGGKFFAHRFSSGAKTKKPQSAAFVFPLSTAGVDNYCGDILEHDASNIYAA